MPVKRVRKDRDAKRSTAENQGDQSGKRANGSNRPASAQPVNLNKSSLDQEVAYYLAHRAEWHEHEGRHVLIHGEDQFGFFPTRDGALEEGFRRFGRVAFLVKEIRQDEEPRPMAWTIL
jgi:hypothetical protein